MAGLYFLDCTRGSEQKSTLAVYGTFLENGGNDNQQPSILLEVTSIDQGLFTWETGTQHIANFPADGTGRAIVFTINSNASSTTDGSQVGKASFARNFASHFEVFRDNGRVLLTTDDGFVCRTAYFSREVNGPA